MNAERKIKVVLAKVGLDGHDRGLRVVAHALKDAGMEVVYLGLRQTAETVSEAALQEDADVVGVSILSAAHMTLFPMVLEGLRERGLDDVLLTGGGIMPKEDLEALRRLGVGELFGPGSPIETFVEYIRDEVTRRRLAAASSEDSPRS